MVHIIGVKYNCVHTIGPLDQLWMLYPSVRVLNVDDEMLVVCTANTILANLVTGISKPTYCLLQLDCTYSLSFLQLFMVSFTSVT